VRAIGKLAGMLALLAIVAPVSMAGAVSSKDKALLQAGVIAPRDAPSTWEARPQPDANPKLLRGIAACMGFAAAETAARKNPFRRSLTFGDPTNGHASTADDTVYAFKTADAATKYFASILASNLPACLPPAYQRQLGSQGQVGPATTIATVPPTLGDQSAGYQMVVTVPGQGTLVLEILAMRVGRAFVGFTFTNPSQPLPLASSFISPVEARLSVATGP
jgi:hypothetical protein